MKKFTVPQKCKVILQEHIKFGMNVIQQDANS